MIPYQRQYPRVFFSMCAEGASPRHTNKSGDRPNLLRPYPPQEKTRWHLTGAGGKNDVLLIQQHELTIFDGQHGKGIEPQTTVIGLGEIEGAGGAD